VTATLDGELHLDRHCEQKRRTLPIEDTVSSFGRGIFVSPDPFPNLASALFHGLGGLGIDRILQGTTPAIALQACLIVATPPYNGAKNMTPQAAIDLISWTPLQS